MIATISVISNGVPMAPSSWCICCKKEWQMPCRDAQPAVRLKVALTLANAQDPEAIAVLIDLLADLSQEERKQVEEILHQLAGEWAPGAVTGD